MLEQRTLHRPSARARRPSGRLRSAVRYTVAALLGAAGLIVLVADLAPGIGWALILFGLAALISDGSGAGGAASS